MAKIERFEDIKGWEKGRELCKLVYEVTNKAPFSRDYGLRDQIRRAAVSVISNIAEGFEKSGNSEFRHFLFIAKGSFGELRSHLAIARDRSFIKEEDYRELRRKALDLSIMIAGLIRYLGQSNLKGFKYRHR